VQGSHRHRLRSSEAPGAAVDKESAAARDRGSGRVSACPPSWSRRDDSVFGARGHIEQSFAERGQVSVPAAARCGRRRARSRRPADFTYVATWSGTVYVAFVLDTHSRRILGWRAAPSMRTELMQRLLCNDFLARDEVLGGDQVAVGGRVRGGDVAWGRHATTCPRWPSAVSHPVAIARSSCEGDVPRDDCCGGG
jgi:transposase InsO family protein